MYWRAVFFVKPAFSRAATSSLPAFVLPYVYALPIGLARMNCTPSKAAKKKASRADCAISVETLTAAATDVADTVAVALVVFVMVLPFMALVVMQPHSGAVRRIACQQVYRHLLLLSNGKDLPVNT